MENVSRLLTIYVHIKWTLPGSLAINAFVLDLHVKLHIESA